MNCSFLNWSFTNSLTFSLSILDNGYIFFFFRTKFSLRSMIWSHVFLISILSNFFFSNTFRYLWNHLFYHLNLYQIFFSYFSSIILAISISFSTIGFLYFFFHSFCLFSFFCSSFHFHHPSFVCFVFYYFPYLSGYLVIFTSPVFQSILEL